MLLTLFIRVFEPILTFLKFINDLCTRKLGRHATDIEEGVNNGENAASEAHPIVHEITLDIRAHPRTQCGSTRAFEADHFVEVSLSDDAENTNTTFLGTLEGSDTSRTVVNSLDFCHQSPEDHTLSPKQSAKLLDLLVQFPLPPPSRPSSLASSAFAQPSTSLQDRPHSDVAYGNKRAISRDSSSHAAQILKKLSRLTSSSALLGPSPQEVPSIPEKKLTISLPLTRSPGSFPTATSIANTGFTAASSMTSPDFLKPSPEALAPSLRGSSSEARVWTRPPSAYSSVKAPRKPSTMADRTKPRHASEIARMTVTTSTTTGLKDLPPSPSLPYTLKFGLPEPSSSPRKPTCYGSPFDPTERIEDWRNDILDTVLRGLQEVSLDLDDENYRSLFDSYASVESTIATDAPQIPLKVDRRSFLDMETADAMSIEQPLATSPSRVSRASTREPQYSWGFRGLGREKVMVEKQVTVDYEDFATGLDSKPTAQSTIINRK
ncbi:hypothetical protein BKA70DRAFT_1505636 [Coprinopsis sp. MPI-PUGE-AT-0042]|nr:hypothetical protein BKA70DRAFT_1505636 [Coprinopsis sp. MPI-PUGE-AT-0042]